MNKLLAIMLGAGALGAFTLSQRDSFQSQPVSRYGFPTGPVHTVYNHRIEKIAFAAVGTVCMAASLYFIVRLRNDDLRR